MLEARWRPQGAPAIYKMMERLDRGPDEVRFILTSRKAGPEDASGWKERLDREVGVEGLRTSVWILAGESYFPKWTGRFRGYLCELRQLIRIVRERIRFRPDLAYFDRANVIIAGVMARFLRVPVVLRIMGVTPNMHEFIAGRRPFEWLVRWAYRSPFALVVCTLDGSGGEEWMKKILLPSVPRLQLFNGVEISGRPSQMDPRLDSLPRDKSIVLFLGRLEPIKDCDIFIDAALRLWDTHRDRLHVLVVGYGSREKELLEKIESTGAGEMFTFIDRLPHSQVAGAFTRADIYVSLNRMGNLSNANLEAMAYGCCIVVPESRTGPEIDIDTDRLIPADAALRVSHENPAESIAGALADLCDHPDKRDSYARNALRISKNLLAGWPERIDREIELLSLIARREAPLLPDGQGEHR